MTDWSKLIEAYYEREISWEELIERELELASDLYLSIKDVNILIRTYKAPKLLDGGRTDGGLFIPEDAVLNYTPDSVIGYIVKIGDNCFKNSEVANYGADYKVGDTVSVPRGLGNTDLINISDKSTLQKKDKFNTIELRQVSDCNIKGKINIKRLENFIM